MKWQDKLNKSQLKHLRDNGVTTMRQATINAYHQRKFRIKYPDPANEPCWICKKINIDLGLVV